MKTARWCLAALIATAAFGSGAADRAPSRIIAYRFQVAPDTDGAQFESIFTPAINGRGEVAFRARIFGFGVASNLDEGIWVDRDGVLQLYLREDDPSPLLDEQGGARLEFGRPGNPNINDAGTGGFGHLGFFWGLQASGDDVLWVQTLDDHLDYEAGALVDVARENIPAPGAGGLDFGQIDFGGVGEHPLLNNAGQTAFFALLASGDSATNSGIWFHDQALSLVLRAGQPAPGVGDGTMSSLGDPLLNGSGQLFFSGSYFTPDRFGFAGLWRSDNGAAPLPVALEIEDPNTAVGTEIRPGGLDSVNTAGQVAYQALFDTEDGNIGGISVRPGSSGLVRADRDRVNPLSSRIVLLESGDVVFIGDQLDPFVNGIFRTFGLPVPVLRGGEPAPLLPAGVTLQRFDNVTANRAGQVAFSAALTGTGVNLANDNALYCTNLDGRYRLVAREGDELVLDEAPNPADSVIATVDSLVLGSGNGADGKRRSFSEDGRLVWLAGVTYTSPAARAGDFGQVILVSECGPPLRTEVQPPRGLLRGHLDSDRQVETASGVAVEQATVALVPQEGFIRSQDPGESDSDYAAFVAGLLRPDTRTLRLDKGDRGRFVFSGLPLVEKSSVGGRRIYKPVYFTVQVTKAQSEELDITAGDGSTATVYFTGAMTHNLRARFENPPDTAIVLTPITAIPTKESLVVDLTRAGPENYQPVEAQVQQHLDAIKAAPTGAQIEGVRRAILGERMARSSIRFADQLLGTMLDGLTALMGDVIDDFLGGNSKRLAEDRMKFDNFQEALDFEKLQGRNWIGFAAGDTAAQDAIKARMGKLIEKNQGLGISIAADLFKKGSNGVFSLVNQALVLAKLDKGVAAQAAKATKTLVDTVFAIAITQGLATGKPLAKFLIGEFIKSNRKVLLDSPAPYSFTALTDGRLDASRMLMEGWSTDDESAFLGDRRAFNVEDAALGTDVLVTANTITAYSKEIADSLGGFGVDLISLLGPKGKAVAKAAKVVKYVSNGVTFGVPFVTVYGVIAGPDVEIQLVLPGLPSPVATLQLGRLERGIKAAFGVTSLPATKRLETAGGTRAGYGPARLTLGSSDLSGAISTAEADLEGSLQALVSALNDDDIPAAVDLTSGSGVMSLLETYPPFERAVGHAIADLQGGEFADAAAVMTYEAVVESDLDLKTDFFSLLEELEGLYLGVMLLEYTGPDDRLYLAERVHLVTLIEAFRASVGTQASEAITALGQKTAPAAPAVVVSTLAVTSDDTNTGLISGSPESFTLDATVRNLGDAAVSGLSALLTVTSVDNAITLTSAAEQMVGTGNLAANDSADGGGDEAAVQWTLTYTGDPGTEERLLLSVDLLQNGASPEDFRPFGDAVILQPDVALYDQDLDGLPDAWEMANGLDPASDDAAADFDGDGLSNERELEVGSEPDLADTDGDNLSDGEETRLGSDGFVTDPLAADTDGDGSPDDIDGAPLDAATAASPDPALLPGEPQVGIDQASLLLTRESSAATVQVTNIGDGTLNWTAVSDSEAVAVVSPVAPDVTVGSGALQVSAAPSFDFDIPGTVSTVVRVIDLGGDDKDFQEIAVTVSAVLSDEIFADGFEQ